MFQEEIKIKVAYIRKMNMFDNFGSNTPYKELSVNNEMVNNDISKSSLVKKQLVSVIIPIYNEERYLEACIESVRRQTWKEIEIILVDDGSSNKAKDICDYYKLKDERIIVIHKQNEGLSKARVSGLGLARGKWISFVDDDDVIADNMIEILMSQCNKNVDIIAGGRIDSTDADAWMASYEFESFFETGKVVCEKIPEDNNKTIITPLWGKIYRAAFLKNNVDVEKYKTVCPTIFFEDILMTPILYYYAKEISIIKTPLYVHREVPTSISRSGKLSAFYYEQIYSGNILLEFLKNNGLKKSFQYEINRYIEGILRIWCLMDINYEFADQIYEDILFYYRKYIRLYIKYSKASIFKKCSICLFAVSRKIFKQLALLFYFNRKNISV